MLSEGKKTEKKSLSRQVMDQIELLIKENQLKPGDALPTEQQLSESLQVSKSSVREAIKMLEALGAVEIRRGLCTVISQTPEQGYLNLLLSHLYLHSESTDDLREFRKMIETAYTTYASKMAVESDLEDLRQALDVCRDHVEQHTLSAEDDIRFHNAILYATHNPFMISLGEAINALFSESISESIKKYPEIALQDHEKIYQGLVTRQEDVLEAAIAESADRWSSSMLPGSTT